MQISRNIIVKLYYLYLYQEGMIMTLSNKSIKFKSAEQPEI